MLFYDTCLAQNNGIYVSVSEMLSTVTGLEIDYNSFQHQLSFFSNFHLRSLTINLRKKDNDILRAYGHVSTPRISSRQARQASVPAGLL